MIDHPANMMRASVRAIRVLGLVCVVGLWAAGGAPAGAAETVTPSVGGTLVDGGVFGPFDGIADGWDWSFDQSSFEGAITLSTAGTTGLEHRVVWEYDLSGITAEPPVTATLTFALRGVSVVPFPNVEVHVYSYPADLSGGPEDFSAGPATFHGSATVVAFQEAKSYTVNVSSAVTEALTSGADRVAFRFQIAPDTQRAVNQSFSDTLDSAPETKPFLTVVPFTPGDADGDEDVDLADFAVFNSCLAGPDALPAPSLPQVTMGSCLDAFDSDADTDVDLDDFRDFQRAFTGG